jgi:heme-degrading monooxygenase HmoA
LTFLVAPGKAEEAVLIYLGSVVPKMWEQRGFRGGLAPSNLEVDEGYTITLWETEEDAEAYESSGVYREQVAKLGVRSPSPSPERSTRSASRCRRLARRRRSRFPKQLWLLPCALAF